MFDFQFNIQLTFNFFGQDSNGNTHVVGSVSFPPLYEYQKADIDIVGVSRKGDVWKGSKLVFKK